MSFSPTALDWNESPIAADPLLAENESMFRQLFERSADAIFLFDPRREVFVDCNQAAIEMMRASSKEQLLMVHPATLSSEFQPDGKTSREKTTEVIELALSKGSHRFEWRARRMDGTEFPLEVLLTPIQTSEHPLMATVCRDITERKAGEAALRESEARFRSLFERSADAMLLFDPQAGVFVDCNSAAVELMRASTKEKLLGARPEDLSPPIQPDGIPSHEKSAQIVALVEEHGGHRFEWTTRRFDGEDVPLEVLVTQIHMGGRKLNVTVLRDITARKRTEAALRESEQKFRGLFEASSDGILILDPENGRITDCNAAALRMKGGGDREWLLSQSIESLSSERQPDGRSSKEAAQAWIERALAHGPQRLEWMTKRYDGDPFPVEVLLTPLCLGGRRLLVVCSRDISDRKKAERELLELNESLERRVEERTAALTTSEAQLRALVEHAPEAIVVFNGENGQFLYGNKHACVLYGVSMDKLATLTPADVSPEFQPGGRRSSELARERMDEALAGGTPVFEWIHQRPDGRLIPTEVRLLRLPAECDNLIRASIIDNTEHKRAEQALRDSEEKFRALFEGSSQGVVLQDENQMLEVNPAAVRIMGCQSSQELLGKHPSDTSPPFQPNGESSAVLARKYIQECMANGSARFDWVGCTPHGKEILLEVTLTRIQWSGRQVIQALIHDIGERKRAEAELRASEARLRESDARFSAAFRASPVFITIARMDDGRYVLANEAFLKWTDYRLDEVLGHNSLELSLWADPAERQPFWEEVRRSGFIHERECRARNRHGRIFTLLISADVIEINNVPHLLTVGLDITQRKQTEAELIESTARLRESEGRFSAAFNSSPIMTGITGAGDGRFVLVNDAALNWTGYSRDEIIGRTSIELGLWEDPAERQRFWETLQSSGSSQPCECRLKNRHGKRSTMLASGVRIEINGEDHLLVMMVDISERKKVEAELQASEARLRESETRFSAAFQASPALIGILRMSDGRYVLANDAHLSWLGYRREEVFGRTCLELGMWEDPAERDSVLKDMQAFGSIRQRECRWRNRRGERFTILLSAETIQLNNTPHMLLIGLDITQRKRAEEEVLKTLEREKELGQLKSNFVSMVSHEFRTPLGIIQSSAELLRDFHGRMEAVERNEQLESISRNTRRMAGMMEEILVLSQLDAGKLIFEPAPLDLNIYCQRVVDEVLSATNRRCHIALSVNSILPEARADERLLGHIFTNLLSNAVKYSEPGAVVDLVVERHGSDAVCIIRDRGIGISEADQQRLFKAFHRGGNVGTRPGTGLGLLIVKRCAELHGGKVQIQSNIGEGTTAIVRLPLFSVLTPARTQQKFEVEQV